MMRLGSAKDVKTWFPNFAAALAFRCILLIHDAARQCQRCENVVFPLCRCTRLSLYLQKKSHLLITSVNDIDFPFSSGQCASQ